MTLKIEWIIQKIRRLHPATVLALSFVLAIAVGTALLMLPVATFTGNISLIDALFTATSAVCVTGLIVVNTGSYYTVFGQVVILALIQIGGLGVMTISVSIFRLLGKNISFRQRLIMQDIFTHTPQENIVHLVRSIVVYTATIESLGASLLFIHWIKEYPTGKALYIALFHSVSAFSNAGFSTFSNSMMNYRGDRLLNVTMSSLIVLGGIGFPVLHELFHSVMNHRTKRFRLSVHTKTVLITTVVLITAGGLVFGILERKSILQEASFIDGLLISLFQSITSRTAGFNTVDISALSTCTLTVMMFLMFFGASPGSCGGGVKTTTLALISAFAWSRIKRN
ncbi:MAG: potassium transporter TrkG, partial [Desulfobacterales bacterium]|nr:potassium transporter TrkG [Desulfobacterales bacterium]